VIGLVAIAALVLLAIAFVKVKRDRVRVALVLPPEASIPDRPVDFGYKMVWLAVSTTDKRALAIALGHPTSQPCNWKIGIERAYENDIFITPPIANWTLVVGMKLPSADANGSEVVVDELLARLSREFGEAQWFANHRIVSYAAWAKAVGGRVIRHFSYLGERGETLRADGQPTAGEPPNLYNLLSPEAQEPGYEERTDLVTPTETTVMGVASVWSVDPRTLDERNDIPEGLGLLVR
jgi:hypothetical protein